jgi:hypothetical protein
MQLRDGRNPFSEGYVQKICLASGECGGVWGLRSTFVRLPYLDCHHPDQLIWRLSGGLALCLVNVGYLGLWSELKQHGK